MASSHADLSCSITPRLMRFNGLLSDRNIGQIPAYRKAADLSIFACLSTGNSVARNQRSNFRSPLELDYQDAMSSSDTGAARGFFDILQCADFLRNAFRLRPYGGAGVVRFLRCAPFRSKCLPTSEIGVVRKLAAKRRIEKAGLRAKSGSARSARSRRRISPEPD